MKAKKTHRLFLFLRRAPFSATAYTSSKNSGRKRRADINTHFQGASRACSALITGPTIGGKTFSLGFGLRFHQSLLGWPLLFGLLARGHRTSLLPWGRGPFWPLWTTSLGSWTFSVATWPFVALISPPKLKSNINQKSLESRIKDCHGNF